MLGTLKDRRALLLIGSIAAACSTMPSDANQTGAQLMIEYASSLLVHSFAIDGTLPSGAHAFETLSLSPPVDVAPPGARALPVTVPVQAALDGQRVTLQVRALGASTELLGSGSALFTVTKGQLAPVDVQIGSSASPGPTTPMTIPPSGPMMMPPPMMTGCARDPTACALVRAQEISLPAPASTTSPTFVDVPGAHLMVTPSSASEIWVVFVSGVLGSTDPGELAAEMRVLIDGTEVDLFGHQTRNTSHNGAGFLSFERLPSSTGAVDVSAQIRASTGTTSVDQLRLTAALIPASADFQIAESNDLTELTGSDLSLATLSFTPALSGDYIVLAKLDQHEAPGGNTAQAWLLDDAGQAHPDDAQGARFSNGRAAWQPMFAATKSTLQAGALATFELRGTSSALSDNPDWWSEAYPYRRKITITAGSAPVPASYAVSFAIDHASLVAAGHALADGSDLRVVKRTAAGSWSEVDRLLDDSSKWNDSATRVWFSSDTPISAATTDASFYAYYGNAFAASPPALDTNVFAFHDGFDQPAVDVSTRWTVTGSPPQMDGQSMVVGPGTTLFASARFAVGPSTIWEARVALSDPAPSLGFWAASNAATLMATDYVAFATDASSAAQAMDPSMTSPISVPSPTAPHVYGFAREQVGDRYYLDGAVVADHPLSASASNLQALIANTSASGSATYDWVRVRSFVDPEPTTAGGAEETLGGLAASQWRYRKLIAFRTDAFDDVQFVLTRELSTTTGSAFQSTAKLNVPAPTAATDYLIIQSERIGGASSDTARKVGELRQGGQALLATSHRINKGAEVLDGYHHSAAVAHVFHTDQPFNVENGFRSPDGISVGAAESAIIVLRYPVLP
jgi:hypothetical protein